MSKKGSSNGPRVSIGFLALVGDLAKERREREGRRCEQTPNSSQGRPSPQTPFTASKPKSEEQPIPQPIPRVRVPDGEFRGEGGERRTALLPGSPPEEISSSYPPREGEEITARTRERFDSMTPEERRAEEPLSGVEFRKESTVMSRVEELKLRTPVRFQEYIDNAMEILASNYEGIDSLIDKMVAERRWKWGREERIIQSAGLAMGDISHIFEKMVKDEAIRRYKNRKEYSKKGVVTPEEVERDFLFTVISSYKENESKEMCLFDAWAKCVSFMVLGKRRSKDLFYALDHPEISRPYEKLGGMEALGVYVGLELPDLDKIERTAKQMGRSPSSLSSSHIGPVFQLAVEAHLTHLIKWIQKAALLWPGDERVVEGFERFVRDELKDFQNSVSEAGFTAEMFFQLLQRERHDGLRDETPLQEIFEKAATGPGRLVYGYQDDVFDALESILDYMYLLRENSEAKKLFINHFLANYPLESNGGTFYKIFGMSLFMDRKDMENHPHTIAAFRTDDDHLIKYHVEEVLRRLEGRARSSTLVDLNQDDLEAAFSEMDDSDSF
ncbi:hypothetical protein GF415_03135 [Candidatus Micrarchaeota archaeon]|nr:hypothetical protein [Candidatus Micrarchaeota archaeon]